MAVIDVIHDEDLARRIRPDFALIAQEIQRLAAGTDAAFDVPGEPWVMSSASSDFVTQGLAPSHVIRIPKRGKVKVGESEGVLYAVDAVVSPATLRLRPLGGAAGTGYPPHPAGTTGLEFVVDSLAPLVEQAAEAIAFRVRTTGRDPAAFTDAQLAVPTRSRTLRMAYFASWRQADPNYDTWQAKMKSLDAEEDEFFGATSGTSGGGSSGGLISGLSAGLIHIEYEEAAAGEEFA